MFNRSVDVMYEEESEEKDMRDHDVVFEKRVPCESVAEFSGLMRVLEHFLLGSGWGVERESRHMGRVFASL